jgi:wyosine [tRNA(Phe)-imidazoG37] synthetase (radical SAM superfamily)
VYKRQAQELLAARELTGVKIVVITNATLFHRERVRDALAFLDSHNGEIWAKLDAGTEEYYKRVDRTPVPFKRVLDNLLSAGRIRPIVIQSLFMRVHGEGPDDAETTAYAAWLRELKQAGCQIKLVQIYTTARQTAESYVSPLPTARLNEIALKVSGLGIPVEVYPGVE